MGKREHRIEGRVRLYLDFSDSNQLAEWAASHLSPEQGVFHIDSLWEDKVGGTARFFVANIGQIPAARRLVVTETTHREV